MSGLRDRTAEGSESMAIVRRLSLLPGARRILGIHFALTLNALTLALATVANGVFGFVYWWVSARFFTPGAVGLASADISLMLLLSLAAEIGLGTLLQGEIPKRRRLAPHLVSAALLISLLSSSILGLGYFATTHAFGRYGIAGALSTQLLLVVGLCVQTVTSVLDAALVGMLQAPLRLFRNLLFAVAKLLLVIGAAEIATPDDWQVNAIMTSWVVGQGLSALCLAAIHRYKGVRIWHRPRFDLLSRRIGVALWHHVLNVAALAPGFILPLIIAGVLSPEQNAPFYAAWQLLALAGVVPSALATVLFTVGSRTASSTASSIRFSLFTSVAAGVVAAVGFWLLSDLMLNILNPVYVHLVGSDLRFLGLSVPLMAVKVHYIAVERLEGRLRQAGIALAAFGAIEVLFAALGAEFGGLLGATTGWLLATGFEAACLWPTVWRRIGRDWRLNWPAIARLALGPKANVERDQPSDAPEERIADRRGTATERAQLELFRFPHSRTEGHPISEGHLDERW